MLTNQAVHELRHKSYALALRQQVRKILHPPGLYLVCDHFAGPNGMSNHVLYMTVDEQKAALQEAGFATVETLLVKGGLALNAART